MMASTLPLTVACLLFGWFIFVISTTRKNFKIGATSGFPTFYSPAHITNVWWLVSHPTLAPILERLLPAKWQDPWLALCQVWQIWKYGRAPFRRVGSDTVMLATPTGNMLWTCDATIAQQILVQHGKTQTPTDMVQFMNIFGKSLGTVEGPEWKRHRRVVTAGFNPSTNAAVWKESIRQIQMSIQCISSEGSVVPVMKDWTLRVALHVIAGVLFHKKLDWSGYTLQNDAPKKGQRMSFQQAIITIILRMGILFTLPKPLLRLLPFKAVRETGAAYDEWKLQIQEMKDEALGRLDSIATKKYKTILESVVLAGTPQGVAPGEQSIPEESISGNIFFMIFAGHETTGNTLGFMLLLLAIYPEHQSTIQAELDRQFAHRTQDEWSVEKDYQVLYSGMIGAVQKETLRLYQVAQFLPRITASPTTVVDRAGTSHIIPQGTLCLIDQPAALRHEEIWTEPKVDPARYKELSGSPALHFDPTRWLRDDAKDKKEVVMDWYLLWGAGEKSCPGKAFASTELTAAMAAIFSAYSLELVVDPNTLAECDGDEARAWNMTRDRAIKMLYDDIESMINIELHKELPVRLVKRKI